MSNLSEFYTKFNNSNGKYVEMLDMQNTFDCTFKFQPDKDAESWFEAKSGTSGSGGLVGMLKNLGNSVAQAASSAVGNAVNNLTGGLVGAITNDVDVMSEKNKNASTHGTETFMEYLANANLMVQDKSSGGFNMSNLFGGVAGNSASSPLELSLGPYIQSIIIPQLVFDEGSVQTVLGGFPLNGTSVHPASNNITFNVLNTKSPIIEKIFYPWLREVTMPYWSYETQPYTTATVVVSMQKHADVSYTFYGCRPQQLNLYQPNQATPSTFERGATFIFDYMSINSTLKTAEDVMSKLKQIGSSLLTGALNML